ncbi:MAG: enoyl-CoA hydratase/isomerase family protein [Caulobacter sp.]|nr:enoyl-CoA hydratase/isomerase family protein [Caulobacter sp.]
MLEGAYAGFDLKIEGPGIAVITFNRPERLNSFNIAMKRDLIEAVTQLQYDDDSKVVLFTGQGRAFSSGDDVGGAFNEDHWRDARSNPVIKGRHDALGTYSSMRTISQGLTRAVRNLDKITIAAINGAAVQSGFSLALACDFRLSVPDAKLGSGTMRMAFLPDEGGHHLIVRMLGVARAKDFLLRGRIVDGRQALEMGLVSDLAEPDQLMERAMALATELAEGPQVALRMLKHAIDNADDLTFEQAGMDIAVRTAVSDHHPDAKEGWRAFAEKRKPKFTG